MNLLLTEAGYLFNPETKVWSKPNYQGIAYSDGDTVEQNLAAIIKQAIDISVLSTELKQYCLDWPSLYHLSSTRANILRPFRDFLEKAEVLEIGAGCGAITRYLGEAGASVLALEGTLRRAAIARSRTRDLPNVTVVSDQFDQFNCDRKFDVITLIGVLEYANLFTPAENPALAMLQRVRSMLKPNGKLIIAIENQLGLKYFAGAPEDHVGQPMYGIEGRYQKDQPQTYGRKVLTEMLKQVNFERSEFMAPFPDYKLPVSIVTERGFSCEGFDASALAWQSVRRDPQLPPLLANSPELVWPVLAQNGIALDLANSFLILAKVSANDDLDSTPLAWHFSSERSKEFCKEARFLQADNESIEVRYFPLVPGATRRVHKGRLTFFIPEKAEYESGSPLAQELIRIITRDGWRIEEVGAFLHQYLDILTSIGSSCNMPIRIDSTDTLIPGNFIDALPHNIIVGHDGVWRLIDKEWTLDHDVPAGWLIFRSLILLTHGVTRFGDTASDFVSTPSGFFQAAFKAAGFAIDDDTIGTYAKMEIELQAQVIQGKLKADEFLNWLNNSPLPRYNLNQAVINRDGEIAKLNQLLTGRDQVVAENEVRLSELKNDVVERDVQISNLNRAVIERDAQISNLKHAVIERDVQISSLNHAVVERDVQLKSILSSKSWLISKPIRFMGRLSRGEFAIALGSIKNKIRQKQNEWESTRESIEPASTATAIERTRSIAVIVPVYRDTKLTKACIESAMPGILECRHAVLVILNDASPESDMAPMLKSFAACWPDRVEILTNQRNLGFVATVNRGMKAHESHDVVLLNSDVILPAGWLERLAIEAYSHPKIGTVTPFSNNTTICTFPEFLQDNPIPFGISVNEVDSAFRGARLPNVEAPTGIGFCMFIRRDCLDDVGYFNEARFGRGYGEENDFCQRAIKRGWPSLITPNLFAFHKGGVSFGSEKALLVENATRTIDELHPNYHFDVQAFIRSDPLKEARLIRLSALLATLHLPKILFISHGLGGGVDQYIGELAGHLYDKNLAFPLVLTPQGKGERCTLRFGFKNTADEIIINVAEDFEYLIRVLRSVGVSLIHFNHVLNVHPLLRQLPKEVHVRYYLTVHDFYLLNGNPTLTDESGAFPGGDVDACFNSLYPLPDGMTPKDWRDSHRPFVEGAEQVIFPSVATKNLFGHPFRIKRAIIAHHIETARNIGRQPERFQPKNSYVIGILGALSREKGADYLEKIAQLVSKTGMRITFVLIGYAYRPLDKVTITGPYHVAETSRLILKHKCDILFFPALCPETYSYTLSYALESALPIVAPALGAFPERLAGRAHVMLFEHRTAPETLLGQLEAFISALEAGLCHQAPLRLADQAVQDFYETTYIKDVPALTLESNFALDFIKPESLNPTNTYAVTNGRNFRESILYAIWRIYSIPGMRRISAVIPFSFRRLVKRVLSQRSIHEVVLERRSEDTVEKR